MKKDYRTTANLGLLRRAFPNLKPKKIVHNDSWKKAQQNNFDTTNNLVLKRFDTLLFRGTSGIALKYLLKLPLTDAEQESVEVNIAKEIMEDDATVKNAIGKINVTLNKFKSRKDKPEDLKTLTIAKSQFRELFYGAKKEYNEKVGE